MEGQDHALTGVVAGLATAGLAARYGHLHTAGVAAWTLAVTGAVAIPDWDTRNSVVCKAVGPATKLLGVGIRGGTKHRGLTHSLLFAAAAGDAAHLVAGYGQLGLTAVLALLIGCLVRGLDIDKLSSWPVVVILAVAAAHTLAGQVDGSLWIGAAVTVGCLAHDLGDLPTEGGVPLLWPIPYRFRLRLFRVGGAFEKTVLPAVLVVAILAVGQWRGYWEVYSR